jgi:hypothetical protein
MATLNRKPTEWVKGYVWCDRQGAIHDDSLDPYDYGEQTCQPADHLKVYRRLRPSEIPEEKDGMTR